MVAQWQKDKAIRQKPDENLANEQAAGWCLDPTTKLLYVSFNTQSNTEMSLLLSKTVNYFT
jgi:hypothetical protein